MKKMHYKLQLVVALFLLGLSLPFVAQAQSPELSSSGIENNTGLTEEEISRLRELLPTELKCSSNPDSPTDFFGNTPLHDAASSGDLYVATFVIECGANPDYQNDFGWTALHDAAYWGHVDVAELLLDAKASLDIQTNIMDWTALHMAAVMGDIDMSELLLDEGADPYTTAGFFKRKTPRDLALDANEIDMLKLFDDRGIEDLSYVEKIFH